MIRIFDQYLYKSTVSKIFFDVILAVLMVLVTSLTQVSDPMSVLAVSLVASLLLAVGVVAVLGSLGFYQRVHRLTAGQTCARAVLGLCLLCPLVYAMSFNESLQLPHAKMFGLTLIGMLILTLGNRAYVMLSRSRPQLRQRVLVFGAGNLARMVGKTLAQIDPNVDLIGYYAGPNEISLETSAKELVSHDRSLTDIVMDEQIDEIVVALAERRGGSMPLRELLDCKLRGVRVVDIATHFEMTLGQIRLDAVRAGWLIFGEGFRHSLLRAITKRVFDIVCSAILILLTWPIMLITGLLIVLESGFPVLYLQERVGLNGRLFNVVKFRSMRVDAEQDGKPRWASTKDDRATRVGRVIRKLRIDELPQLFSVLSGAMSLVGPRPERPYFVDKLTQEIPFFAVRQSIKPGVTGWAQVRYQYGASVEDAIAKLQYDLYYVKNHSLFLDIVILFETVGVVLTRQGAQ